MEPESRGKSTDFLLILSIGIAMFMTALDGTIVNIALPTISTEFSLSSSTVSLVSTLYLLVMAGCVLIFGKVSDNLGFKKVFLAGFIIFTIGSFTCGFLPEITGSFLTLLISRVFQALGGAMLAAIAPAMITAYIPMERKGKAMAIIMTVAALGMAIGPTIGGILTEYLSWGWIFFINVPVGIIALLLGIKVIPEVSSSVRTEVFDKIGAVLIFVALGLLLFAFSEGETIGWTDPVIVGSLIISVLAFVLFSWQEHRISSPLLDLSLFKDKNFLMSNLVLILLFLTMGGLNYLLPFYLELVQGFSTSNAGLILSGLSFAMMIAGLIVGVLYNRIGGKKLSIIAGFLLAIGYYLMTYLKTDTTLGFVLLCLILIGLGIGLMITPVSNIILMSVPKRYAGMTSSLISLERFAPMTIGIALFNLIFFQGMLTIAKNHGVTMDAPVNIKTAVLVAGFDLTFFSAFILGIITLLLIIVIKVKVDPEYLED